MQLYCVMDVQCMHIIKQNQTKVVVAKKMGLDKLKCFSGYIENILKYIWLLFGIIERNLSILKLIFICFINSGFLSCPKS